MSALQGSSETTWCNLGRSLKETLGPQIAKGQGDPLLDNPALGPVAKIPLLWEHL